jgi:hypothetical protein
MARRYTHWKRTEIKTGLEAGARFLDLRNGLAPNKLTAEMQHTSVVTQKEAEISGTPIQNLRFVKYFLPIPALLPIVVL